MTEIRNQVDNYVTSFAQTVPAELPLNIKIASSIIPDSLNEFAYQDHGISATSNESQVHGRKMLRRVANRRSAQQSRARKKVSSSSIYSSQNFSPLISSLISFKSGSHG